MRSSIPTRGAVAVALLAAAGLFAAISTVWEDTAIGVFLSVGAAALMLFMPSGDALDHDTCEACSHSRVEHHGICQACQRDVVRNTPDAPTFACERFSVE